jgi:hypothetical protein
MRASLERQAVRDPATGEDFAEVVQAILTRIGEAGRPIVFAFLADFPEATTCPSPGFSGEGQGGVSHYL